MRKRINTFTHSPVYASATREREQSVVNDKCRLIQIPETIFRQGFTRIYTGLFGFIALICIHLWNRWLTTFSTIVESALQIGPLFFKTKPICWRCKSQVSSVMTKDYEEKARLASKSKQSQTNPISMLRWASFSGLGELAEGM